MELAYRTYPDTFPEGKDTQRFERSELEAAYDSLISGLPEEDGLFSQIKALNHYPDLPDRNAGSVLDIFRRRMFDLDYARRWYQILHDPDRYIDLMSILFDKQQGEEVVGEFVTFTSDRIVNPTKFIDAFHQLWCNVPPKRHASIIRDLLFDVLCIPEKVAERKDTGSITRTNRKMALRLLMWLDGCYGNVDLNFINEVEPYRQSLEFIVNEHE
jgi:hypothetical protein